LSVFQITNEAVPRLVFIVLKTYSSDIYWRCKICAVFS